MIGRRLVQCLTTSRPMVITLQLVTEDSLPINRGTGGLEERRIDPPKQQRLEKLNGMNPRELLLPRFLTSVADTSRSLLAEAAI